MKNILLASTSTLFGGQYLDYLKDEIADLFQGVDEIVFIPYARPSGISHDDYTQKVKDYFSQLNIAVTGLHTYDDPPAAIREAKGVFTGGGNTFCGGRGCGREQSLRVIKDHPQWSSRMEVRF